MKLAVVAALVLAPSVFAAEADSAYKALRVYGKKFGESSLNRVIELRGRGGSPQPAVWKVIAADSGARGGVREVEIQHGRIIGERSPTNRGGGGPPMNFSQLNLDSDGAFTIVNQEMQKRRVPFDRLDYTLRNPSANTPPVWFIDLYDGSRGKVGNFEIAADTGAVLSEGRSAGRPPDYAQDRDYVRRDRDRDRDDREDGDDRDRDRELYRDERYDDGHSRPGEPFRSPVDFFQRLGRRFEKRGHQLKNFFTGEDRGRR